MRISVGQKWRCLAPSSEFYTKGNEYTVLTSPNTGDLQFSMQDDSFFDPCGKAKPHYWHEEGSFFERFELVGGPVRTVTHLEVVPGYYGPIHVTHTQNIGEVGIRISSIHGPGGPDIPMNAAQLRAASIVFGQLADALDDKP